MRASAISRIDAAVAALLAGVSVAYLWPLRRYGYMINDDGWYLHPTLRMLNGEVLYRDIWTFYAPFEYHLLSLLFRLGEPSILLARSLWVALLVLAVVGSYFVARRFAPPGVAWIPALVFALLPGQWSKALYGLCTVTFFLALAIVVVRPCVRHFTMLGLMVGFSAIARQDLGLVQLVLASVAVVALCLRPRAFGDDPAAAPRNALARALAVAAGIALAVAPVLAYYGAHHALPDLIDATLIRGVVQRRGWYAPGFESLFSWRNFLGIAEGRLAGTLMLTPLLAYASAGLLLSRRLVRHGLDPDTLLLALLLGYALAGLANTYYQMRLLRLLETGIPFYLTTTWVLVEATRTFSRPTHAAGAGLAGLAALYVASILFWVPHFLPEEDYSGSLRMRRFDSPVTLLGDTLYVPIDQADELRLLRAFVEAHTRTDEPIFAAPLCSLYYVLLERHNPTRVVAVHFREDRILTDEQKRAEMEKLRASGARYAIVMATWLSWYEPPDLIRRTLLEEFYPVRAYGSMLVLERGTDARYRRLASAYAALTRGGARPAQLPELESLVDALPEEPLAWTLLGVARLSLGHAALAAAAFDRAAALDPLDPRALELGGQALASAGQRGPAAERFERALSLRENPRTRALLQQLVR